MRVVRLREIEEQIKLNTVELQKAFAETIPMVAGTPQLVSWQAQDKVFSVAYEGQRLFPGFQFDDSGQPLPLISQVLLVFSKDPDRSSWDDAFWFFGASGWLDGATPIEALLKDSQSVLLAAQQAVLGNEC